MNGCSPRCSGSHSDGRDCKCDCGGVGHGQTAPGHAPATDPCGRILAAEPPAQARPAGYATLWAEKARRAAIEEDAGKADERPAITLPITPDAAPTEDAYAVYRASDGALAGRYSFGKHARECAEELTESTGDAYVYELDFAPSLDSSST